MRYRAYLLDFWLFLRRIAPNGAAIAAVLLGSAGLFHGAQAWPEATYLDCLVRAFYMMTIESVEAPRGWYLEIFIFILPILGLLLAAEGLVSATVLFFNRSQRQGEWNAVVAATYRGHTVVCGLGQLGGTLCEGLLADGRQVVGVELDEHLPAVVTARRRNLPVVIGDMTLHETLAEANVLHACCVVCCSGDDLANLEAAISAKELNPRAEVYARVFKKSFADRINDALKFDLHTFSPYTTAAEAILKELTRPQ